MTNFDFNLIQPYENALGAEPIASLAERDLLRRIEPLVAAPLAVDPSIVADRIAGAVAGLALGDAFAGRVRRHKSDEGMDLGQIRHWLDSRRRGRGGDRVSAPTQTFVVAAEALLADTCRAPAIVAEQLDRRSRSLRSPGQAVQHATRARRNGARWFEAAAPSYGDAALPRAVAVGLALHNSPERIGISASLDSAVTHASRRATASNATLAAIVASLITRPDGTDPADVIEAVAMSIDHDLIRETFESMFTGNGQFAVPFEPIAVDSLMLAIWSMQFGPDLADALNAAMTLSGGDRATLAITGALRGAIFGTEALPDRQHDLEGAAELRVLAQNLATGSTPAPTTTDTEIGADIWFLLDRSGSMASIAEFVVDGFDVFFRNQRAQNGEARVTVAQFDGEDPHDVIIDGLPLDQVPSIGDRFQPRGMTPLYDAIGLIIDRAERHGGDPADQLMVILTDGHENASVEWTQQNLFNRIATLRQQGWTFVFLGANQDSYAAGDQMAMPAGNVSNFRPDEEGLEATYAGLHRTVTEWRSKDRSERRRDADQFWGDRKEGEEFE